VFSLVGLIIPNESISKESMESTLFACCDCYLTDSETGESFVGVTVCTGGSDTASYIAACTMANGIRDMLLSL